MAEFKALAVEQYPRVEENITVDSLYWQNLKFPIALKEYGAIDYIDFSSEEPHNIAVTSSSVVHIFCPDNNSIRKKLSRFRHTAYGGVFRKDGRLVVAGSEDGSLRLFETNSTKLLRIFKGHKAATHRCDFARDSSHVVSFSDDKSVAIWDIPTEKKIQSFEEEHKDYIRAGVVNQSTENIIISGSYDHMVKMYDARTSSGVLSVDHGAPVESILMLLSGGLFLSAGGTSIKVWDPVAGRLFAEFSHHHKTITSLCLASNGTRLMSGGLDRHIKIYDVSSYEVVHTLAYPSPILSIGCAPEDKIVAAGMTDGLLSISHRKEELDESTVKTKKNRKNFFRYYHEDTNLKLDENDIVIRKKQSKKLEQHDRSLRKFESTRALDSVLTDIVQRTQPELVISVMMELMKRGSLRTAIAGRQGPSFLQLLKFVSRKIGDQRFTRVLTDVGLQLIDIYGSKLNDPATKKMFQYLLDSVSDQVQYLQELSDIQGRIQTALTAENSRNEVQETVLSNNITTANSVELS